MSLKTEKLPIWEPQIFPSLPLVGYDQYFAVIKNNNGEYIAFLSVYSYPRELSKAEVCLEKILNLELMSEVWGRLGRLERLCP